MSEWKDEFDRVHMKLDRVEDKLDDHLDRLSKAEEAITWIRGHLKISTTVVLAMGAWVLSQYVSLIIK